MHSWLERGGIIVASGLLLGRRLEFRVMSAEFKVQKGGSFDELPIVEPPGVARS